MNLSPVPVTFLFCPGNRPDRFDKALSSGAPGIIIDLEDAVPDADKDLAREHALHWLGGLGTQASRPVVGLRISSPASLSGLEDLRAVAQGGFLPGLDMIVLPKAEDASEIRLLSSHLRRVHPTGRIMALIESARGVRNAALLAGADSAVCALAFGAADYCVESGVDNDWQALAYVRSRLVFDLSGTGIPLLDVPHIAIEDETGLRLDCARARAMGFHGKLTIHPRQVKPVLASFAPAAEQIAWANGIIAAYRAAGFRACKVNGTMVDEPVYKAACRISASATTS